ncbi:MAG TPA: cytochrome P450 [Candidatus Stackebrandtia excrementipullorum]|nr:cytochrome P450 [Candidatus Stackebrandtia excrementipullorum]
MTDQATGFPKLSGDVSIALYRTGYSFIGDRLRHRGTDGFRARFLGRPTIFMRGHDAAQIFYDNTKFTRVGVVPEPVKGTLFGKNTVHGLDGVDHRHRKAMFVDLVDAAAVSEITDMTGRLWLERLPPAGPPSTIVLFDEAVQVLATAVCRWAGLATDGPGFTRFASDLAVIVDGFGDLAVGGVKARRARWRCRRWAKARIRAVRAGLGGADPNRAVSVVAFHRDRNGGLLGLDTAADELLNLLRPTVAVAWFVAFAALALHEHPRWREPLSDGVEPETTAFTHEVRRYFPFAPFLSAWPRRRFVWRGQEFKPGTRVVLDVYGTNHDPSLWRQSDDFDPTRFFERVPDSFDLIPQGGGDRLDGHRCPGEPLTVALLKQAVQVLAATRAEPAPGRLTYLLSRFPSRVAGGVVMQPAAT